MVGQRFIFIRNHPWFEVTTIAASQSAGKTYKTWARWKMDDLNAKL